MFSIRKSSTELNDASEPRWHFPSALSPEAHAEWDLYKILEYMGLHEIPPSGAGKNRAKLRKDIEEYHIAYAIDFDDSDIDTFMPETGVRGSLHTNQFLTRLESLGVKNTNTREAIRNRTVQKTLSMSDMILKFFFIALNSKTDWTLQNLPTEIVNKNMERFNLHLQPPRL